MVGTMQLRGVDANLLVALRALLRERNVTRAAQSIGLGQSSMSHALSRLRAHFGDPLLVRAGRALVLTERARSLVEPVDAAAAQLERVFLQKPAYDPASSDREFRIVGTDNLELYLMPRVAQLLEREAPGVTVRFHPLRRQWARALQQGDADLKLGRSTELPRDLHGEDLLEERFVCAVRARHPAKRLDLATYVALRHVAIAPTLGLGESYTSVVDELLGERGLTRHVAITVSQFLAAPFVVQSSNLVLTASERLLGSFAGSLGLRLVRPPIALQSYRLSQVWSERAHTDEGHAWLRGLVSRAARSIDTADSLRPKNR